MWRIPCTHRCDAIRGVVRRRYRHGRHLVRTRRSGAVECTAWCPTVCTALRGLRRRRAWPLADDDARIRAQRKRAMHVSHPFGAPVDQAVVWRVAARVRAVLRGGASVRPHERNAGLLLPLQRSLPPGCRLLLQLFNPRNTHPASARGSGREAKAGRRGAHCCSKRSSSSLSSASSA